LPCRLGCHRVVEAGEPGAETRRFAGTARRLVPCRCPVADSASFLDAHFTQAGANLKRAENRRQVRTASCSLKLQIKWLEATRLADVVQEIFAPFARRGRIVIPTEWI